MRSAIPEDAEVCVPVQVPVKYLKPDGVHAYRGRIVRALVSLERTDVGVRTKRGHEDAPAQ